jgi:hypothetical protein
MNTGVCLCWMKFIPLTSTHSLNISSLTLSSSLRCAPHVGGQVRIQLALIIILCLFYAIYFHINKANCVRADVVFTPWEQDSDGCKQRTLSYTLPLNYAFLPKFAHNTEKQVGTYYFSSIDSPFFTSCLFPPLSLPPSPNL